MHIHLQGLGKKFNREWIFKNLTYSFITGNCYAITGNNGSGKSTLLKILAGYSTYSEGSLLWKSSSNNSIESDAVYKEISIAAPYLELIEEMTAIELMQFHLSSKQWIAGFDNHSILKKVGLEKAANKQIKLYSSGMKQRLKLALAFFSKTELLLLDEPCSNLDAAGVEIYHSLLLDFTQSRTTIICSNDPTEYPNCNDHLSIMDYK